MSVWKDTTSYSRSDVDRKPSCFSAKSGSLNITVTNGHIHYKGKWIMHCFKLGIDTMPLPDCANEQEAKHRAIAIVRDTASRIVDDANGFTL